MSPASSPTRTLLRPVIAVVGLVVILMLVLSYWGDYRSGAEPEPGTDTTGTVEATDTAGSEAGGEATESDTGEDAEQTPADSDESMGTVVVLIEGLNFRTGPSRDADLIRGLNKGDRLTHLGTEDGWYKVRSADGKEGYVSASAQYTDLEQ